MLEFLKKLKYPDLLLYLRDHSALFAKYFVTFSLARKAKEKSILVYTMGKVGSTTIRHSIDNQMEDYSVYHVHWLKKEHLDTDREFNKKFFRRNKNNGIKIDILPSYLIRGYYLQDKIKTVPEQYKIVTLTRDPVARNVSAFFQNLKKFFAYDISKRIKEVDEDVVLDELIELFLNKYIDQNRIDFFDSDPLTWFDEELKHIFGIDVYQYEFPRERGYEIYTKDAISALVIRLESLNNCFEESIKELLGESVQINRMQNRSNDKEYSTIYQRFKDNIEIPSWYLDKMYSSKYARHFYTDKEIFGFRKKWDRKGTMMLKEDKSNVLYSELVRG